MSNLSEQQEKEKQRERRRNNRFYERLAVILIFILLVFAGASIFIYPKEKVEINFDQLNISGEIKHEEDVKIEEEGIKVQEEPDITTEEMNEQIVVTNTLPKKSNYTQEDKKRLIAMRKKNIQEILDKKLSIKTPQRKKQTVASKNYRSKYIPPLAFEEDLPIQDIPEYEEEPVYQEPAPRTKASGGDDYFDILLKDTTCRPAEIEYVLKLYTSKYSQPLTLVFRRNGLETGTPEIIYATLPNNKWKDIKESLGNVMQTLFDELLGDDNSKHPANLKKVTAMITTECSSTQYVSQAFYVSPSTPAATSAHNAQNYCRNKGGRLPDILELIAIVTHKQMPSGYYMTNSERLSTDRYGEEVRPLGDYLVLELRGNNIYFTSSSKISNRSVYAECVMR